MYQHIRLSFWGLQVLWQLKTISRTDRLRLWHKTLNLYLSLLVFADSAKPKQQVQAVMHAALLSAVYDYETDWTAVNSLQESIFAELLERFAIATKVRELAGSLFASDLGDSLSADGLERGSVALTFYNTIIQSNWMSRYTAEEINVFGRFLQMVDDALDLLQDKKNGHKNCFLSNELQVYTKELETFLESDFFVELVQRSSVIYGYFVRNKCKSVIDKLSMGTALRSPSQWEILWGYIRILRITNFIGIAFIVGLSTLIAVPNPQDFPFVYAFIGGIGLSFLASSGSVMNDAHDLPWNRITYGRENRVLVMELMSPLTAWIYSITLGVIGLYLFSRIGWSVFFVGVALLIVMFAYTQKIREVNGFASNVVIAIGMATASGFGGFITGENSWEIFFLFSFGFLVTLTREIRLDIGDIFTDRKANLKTVPITFGIEKAYVFAVTILVILVAYSYLPMLLGVYSKNYGILVTALNLFSFIIALAMVKRKGPSLQKFGLKVSMFLYPLVVTISQIFL